MIPKHILVLDRVRRPPADGWSWIDRRFLREHAPRLSHEAILLYFFLAAVSDKDGLSFYGDATIALRLRMAEAVVVRARDELVAADLVAYRAPFSPAVVNSRSAEASRISFMDSEETGRHDSQASPGSRPRAPPAAGGLVVDQQFPLKVKGA